MTGPYGQLISKVQHIKDTYKKYVGIDASSANLMRPAMYDAYHHADVLGKENEPHNFKCNITGALCENNDQLAKNRYLPQIEIGDWVYICDAGAHGSAMGYNYNGRLHCAEYLYRTDGTMKLIKDAQTIVEYLHSQGFNYINGKKDCIPVEILK